MLLLALSIACTAPPTKTVAPSATDTAVLTDTAPPGDTADTDTDTVDTEEDEDTDGLFGAAMEPGLPVPKFAATNRDGTPRGPENLVGDPTIIWFFRDAGSAG